jgi:hypothetical protein
MYPERRPDRAAPPRPWCKRSLRVSANAFEPACGELDALPHREMSHMPPDASARRPTAPKPTCRLVSGRRGICPHLCGCIFEGGHSGEPSGLHCERCEAYSREGPAHHLSAGGSAASPALHLTRPRTPGETGTGGADRSTAGGATTAQGRPLRRTRHHWPYRLSATLHSAAQAGCALLKSVFEKRLDAQCWRSMQSLQRQRIIPASLVIYVRARVPSRRVERQYGDHASLGVRVSNLSLAGSPELMEYSQDWRAVVPTHLRRSSRRAQEAADHRQIWSRPGARAQRKIGLRTRSRSSPTASSPTHQLQALPPPGPAHSAA